MFQHLKMAYRNLHRNRRRSILSALAVSMGLALLMLMAAVLEGEMRGSMQLSIQLVSGHVQVRAASYQEERASLKWEDLVADPERIAAQIKTLPQVQEATPRLIASGILAAGDQSSSVQIIGMDPSSQASAPFVRGLVSGEFLAPDDREGILIGQPLADKLKLRVGDRVELAANTSNGDVDQQTFILRGLYSTRTPAYDENTVLMPLAKAQALTRTENHATLIFILLHDRDQAGAVAAALSTPAYQIVTWQKMNEFILQTEQFANAYMLVLYLIVLAITATVVVNTLVMAVFERTREIGILAAIGMKSRRIMALFLTEAGLLALAGIAFGLVLGWLLCAYFARHGFYIGNVGLSSNFLLGDTIYAYLTWEDTLNLTIVAFAVTVAASLYPALLAARLEPIEALHGK